MRVKVEAERVTLYRYFSRIQYRDGSFEYVLRDDEIDFCYNPINMTVTAIFNRKRGAARAMEKSEQP